MGVLGASGDTSTCGSDLQISALKQQHLLALLFHLPLSIDTTRGLRWGAGPGRSQAAGSRPGSLQCDLLAESMGATKLPVPSVSAL